MKFELQQAKDESRSIVDFTIISAQIFYKNNTLTINGQWNYSDGSFEKFLPIHIQNYDKDGEIETSEFSDLLKTLAVDEKIHNLAGEKLKVTGTFKLEGEPT